MDRSGDRRPMPRRGRRLGALALSKSKKNEESIHKRRTYNPATDEGVTKTTNKNDPILKAEVTNPHTRSVCWRCMLMPRVIFVARQCAAHLA